MRLDLEAMNRAARIMGLENEFLCPLEGNDKELLNAARAFARNALPLKAQFIAHEMPEDFLEDLAADIAEFEAMIAKQSDARGGHVAASEVLDDLFDEGTELQRDLDGFMRNKFANNAEVLAEWTRGHPRRTRAKKEEANTAAADNKWPVISDRCSVGSCNPKGCERVAGGRSASADHRYSANSQIAP